MEGSDTSPEAALVQAEIWRGMGGLPRLRLASSMSDDARMVARAGIRNRRPDLTEAEVTLELIRLMHGLDLRGSPVTEVRRPR